LGDLTPGQSGTFVWVLAGKQLTGSFTNEFEPIQNFFRAVFNPLRLIAAARKGA
jgi:hypothetical protein